ncbi:ABC transporter permease [Nocardioides sp. cx-173]|uniref:ABC transporter permease n=1 Tax=Nocardioides sp. cx-173 TaxID=2898796 RepID=UPI001E5C6F35|nr:ABC transporter permease [Nocardioides sp. cx-173]MCD4524226.1 ABC transporter permease [Nocardioides sp. cx-173]UGB41618.1 ABC transporter permease [Nocardioides sp. cx-173]
MTLNVLQRVGRSLLVVVLVTVAVVWLLSLAPGSAADVILGENATPEAVADLNAELGLDEPLWQQYTTWIGNAVTGDLGTSPINDRPVMTAISERLPVTLELAFVGLFLALVSAIILAVLSAWKPGSALDRAIGAFTSVLLSVPAFIAGPLLIYFFALKLGWLPVAGWGWIGDGLADNLRGIILPALAISLIETAAFYRVLRSDLLATLREDYFAAARAKGMSWLYVLFRHALRPSSFSLITLAGINLGRLIGGTVIVEALFGFPGLGQLIAMSITTRDIVTVQGAVAFIAVAYVVVNMLVDVSYGFLDPRVRKAARA